MAFQTTEQIIAELRDLGIRPGRDGRYRFWKVVTADRAPPVQGGGIRYRDGAEISIKRYSSNPRALCGMGLHVLIHPNVGYGHRLLLRVVVAPEDIVCVPHGTAYALAVAQRSEGASDFTGGPKVRVRRLTVIGPAK